MNFEKLKKASNNGSVKVAEKVIALMGIPIILAFLGWMGATLVDVGEEVTTISVRQMEVILPKLEDIKAADYIKRSEFEEEEARVDTRMNRIERRIDREIRQ